LIKFKIVDNYFWNFLVTENSHTTFEALLEGKGMARKKLKESCKDQNKQLLLHSQFEQRLQKSEGLPKSIRRVKRNLRKVFRLKNLFDLQW
jgi:hypothetical protein